MVLITIGQGVTASTDTRTQIRLAKKYIATLNDKGLYILCKILDILQRVGLEVRRWGRMSRFGGNHSLLQPIETHGLLLP